MHECPCCTENTLPSRGDYEICGICFWEDDGTTEVDVMSDPNHCTLAEGRRNFRDYGSAGGSAEAKRRGVQTFEFEFTLAESDFDDVENKLWDILEGSDPDYFLSSRRGEVYVSFDRPGPDLKSAIDFARKDLKRVGLTPLTVTPEPGELQ